MRININLTAAGLSASVLADTTSRIDRCADLDLKSPEHYKKVVSIVYEYLAILRSSPPLQWSWEETAQLGRVSWKFKEKGSPQGTARGLASKLSTSRYPPSKTLIAAWFATEWNEDEIRAVLDCVKPELGRVFVGSKEPVEGKEFWKEKEKVRT